MFPGTVQRTSTDVPNMCREQAPGAQHYDHSQVHTSSSTRPWHCRMHVMSPLTIWAQPRDSSCWPRLCVSAQVEARTLVLTPKTLVALDLLPGKRPSTREQEYCARKALLMDHAVQGVWTPGFTVFTHLLRVTRA